MRDGERIGGRAGWDQEHRDLPLENFRKLPLNPLGPLVVAITKRIAGVGAHERLHDLGSAAGGVVAREIHVASFGGASAKARRLGRMQFCCAAGVIYDPLVTSPGWRGQQTVRSRWKRPRTPLQGR